MERIISRAVALAGCAVLGLCLGARAQGPLLRAEIPFAFHLRESVLPAGEYEIRIDAGVRQVTLMATTGLVAARYFALPAKAMDDGRSVVVFHKYGNSYFLDKIGTRSSPIAFEAPRSKKEHQAERMARAYAKAEVAEVRITAVPAAR